MAQLTEDQRRAYARIARDYPHKLGEVANKAGVKPETVKDWIRDYFGSTRSKQGVPPPRVPPIVPPVPPTPPVSRTTVSSAIEDATDALAKRMKRWFRGKKRRKRDADILRAIISKRKKYKRTPVAQPGAIASGHSRQPTTHPKTKGADAPPPKTHNVYVLDAGLLSALASNDDDAWACLETLVGERNTVVVPVGAVGYAFRNTSPHPFLEEALVSSCIRQVPLDYVEARAAGMLCRETPASALIDASVVIAAKPCWQVLTRKGDRKNRSVHIVSQDVNKMTDLIHNSGLSRRDPEPCRNWYLLAIAGSRQ